jgi:Asp-tRNA(Asn)/Glu-tRNA(Gln) amidotransferase A subunit family amidase
LGKSDLESVYDLKSVQLPYLTGFPLRMMVALLESPLRGLILPTLFQNAGITWFREQEFNQVPTFEPIHYSNSPCPSVDESPKVELPQSPQPGPGFRFSTIHDYAQAYRAGKTTPEEVAEKVLAAIEASEAADPPLCAFIALNRDEVLAQARQATKRLGDGEPISVFDGVPVAVKDELDMTPYPTTAGTSFLGSTIAKEDATVVARLRAAGALLLGKTNMHEIGIGVTGLNPHHGTTRNPYHSGHFTGGSSSGPATAVAAGFCPVAIGADGGGSIRIPSAFCGQVGLKPTFGRVSEFGAAPLCWSLAHVGPIAATVTDAALTYTIIAGLDAKDANTLHQPTLTLERWTETDLSDLILGVYWPWFRHASPEVVSICEAMLDEFQRMGAKLKEITIPNLKAGRVAHVIIIASEMTQGLDQDYSAHHGDFGLDVRMNLALARQFRSRDYVKAQRARTQMIDNFNRALTEVDAIITPACGVAAPPIADAALPDGESDLTTLTEIMRFAVPGNMTGLPAIAFPAGYTEKGLPVGLQAMGRAWEEATLLRLAWSAERVVERKGPQIFYPILAE